MSAEHKHALIGPTSVGRNGARGGGLWVGRDTLGSNRSDQTYLEWLKVASSSRLSSLCTPPRILMRSENTSLWGINRGREGSGPKDGMRLHPPPSTLRPTSKNRTFGRGVNLKRSSGSASLSGPDEWTGFRREGRGRDVGKIKQNKMECPKKRGPLHN